MRIYAVGDIHGHLDKLESLMNKLPLFPDDRLVFLGDYIDRGPDSRGVISLLLQIKEQHNCVFLCGNHEHMMRDYLQGCRVYDRELWILNGGSYCLQSYGIVDPVPGSVVIPSEHTTFLQSLKYYHQEPGFVFVHGGLKPHLPLEKNRWKDILWPRSAFYTSRYHWPEGVVVFGHTPFDKPLVESNKIGIDTGHAGAGPLTSVRLPELEFFQV